MDHADEQAMEMEALEAILDQQMAPVSANENPAGFSGAQSQVYVISMVPSEEPQEGDDSSWEMKMELLFAHTPLYPEEPPLWRLRAVRGLSDADVAEASAQVEAEVQESLGMAMVYQLVTVAKDWLIERAGRSAVAAPLDPDAARRKAEAEEEQRMQDARRYGDMVTVENFMAWKAKFDAEMEAASAPTTAEASAEASRARKLTGKEYFLQLEATRRGDEEDGGVAALGASDDDEEFNAELEREMLALVAEEEAGAASSEDEN